MNIEIEPFTCADGNSKIAGRLFCNGRDDCSDGSDEGN